MAGEQEGEKRSSLFVAVWNERHKGKERSKKQQSKQEESSPTVTTFAFSTLNHLRQRQRTMLVWMLWVVHDQIYGFVCGRFLLFLFAYAELTKDDIEYLLHIHSAGDPAQV